MHPVLQHLAVKRHAHYNQAGKQKGSAGLERVGWSEAHRRPGEFPLGSELSRAAGRAMLKTQAAIPGESIPTAIEMLSPETAKP
jgi:hypothetical protein